MYLILCNKLLKNYKYLFVRDILCLAIALQTFQILWIRARSQRVSTGRSGAERRVSVIRLRLNILLSGSPIQQWVGIVIALYGKIGKLK